MSLKERMREFMRAGFSGLWVQSVEPDDAVAEIAGLCREESWVLAAWDVDTGLEIVGEPSDAHPRVAEGDPLAVVRAFSSLSAEGRPLLLVLRNFHWFLDRPEVVQALELAIASARDHGTSVVVLSPVSQIPIELEPRLTVVEHLRPDRDQLASIVHAIVADPGQPSADSKWNAVLDAATGLARSAVEDAVTLSLVRHGRVVPEVLWEHKTQRLARSGLLSIPPSRKTFADLGGLDVLKEFTLRAARRRPTSVKSRPRGVWLAGAPGTGKRTFAVALGGELGRPTLELNSAALMISPDQLAADLVHQIQAVGPCVVLVDGVTDGMNAMRSGSPGRQFNTLAANLVDRARDAYFVYLTDDVLGSTPWFARAGRLDAAFFIDLPTEWIRERIWQIHLERYELDPEQPRPYDRRYTGADVELCCRLAALLDVSLLEAGERVTPAVGVDGVRLDRLRDWAHGRFLSADRPGLYAKTPRPRPGSSPGRGFRRGDPSCN